MNIHHYFFTFTYSFCLWIVHLHMQYRGGSRISSYGGGALKKIAPSGGRRENCWGISCEKSRFYAKKSYFFPILGEARAGCSPWIRPCSIWQQITEYKLFKDYVRACAWPLKKNVLKAIYWFHILCFNRTNHNYWLWNPVLIRYRMRNKDFCLCWILRGGLKK